MARLTLIGLATLCLASGVSAQDPELFEILETNELSPWRVLGPFSSTENVGLATEFIDETDPDLDATHAVRGDDQAQWVVHDFADGTSHLFDQLGGEAYDTFYLYRTITAVTEHQPTISIGMDDSAALWVNGTEVFRQKADHAVECGRYGTKVTLRAGENTILLKVVNNRGPSGFCFEVTDKPDRHARWGAGRPEDGFDHYEVTRVPIPEALRMEVGGLLFEPDGSLLVASRRGHVFRIHNPAENDPDKLRVTTFAEGLHEPLGLLHDDDGSLLVSQIPELTRLRDTDGDGRADEFETLTQAWGLSGNYHEYHFGPVRDGNGDLWCTLNIGFPSGDGAERLYRGSAYRFDGDEGFRITCYGLRSPNGVTEYEGQIFYTDNQGEWMDVCRLAHLQPMKYYGHHVPLQWSDKMPDFGWEEERTLPAVWYPYHLMRSTSWPVVDRTGGKFGPYAGQIIVGDQNNALLVRTTLELVDGVYQGACYPFWQGFDCGVNRLAFDRDGVLYVGSTARGWGSVGPEQFGLQRVRFTGKTPFDLLEVRATHDGFDLEFTKPLVADASFPNQKVYIREYGYEYWSTYGSGEIDSRDIEVLGTDLSDDRRILSVRTGERNTGKAFQITLRGVVRSESGELPITQEAFYTLHRVPAH